MSTSLHEDSTQHPGIFLPDHQLLSQSEETLSEQDLLFLLKHRLTREYPTVFEDAFAEEVWASTYKDHNDEDVSDTVFRVAAAAGAMEHTTELRLEWTEKFYMLLTKFCGTCGGRIYANAGTEWGGTTLMNCISGDTKVITNTGIVNAGDIPAKSDVYLLTEKGTFEHAEWNSHGIQRLYAITFSNGEVVYATEGHEWVVTRPQGGTTKVPTSHLVDRNVPLNGIVGYEYKDHHEYIHGVKNGLVFGDGYKYTDFTNGPKHSALQQFGDSRHLVLDVFGYTSVTFYKGDPEGIHYVGGLPEHLKDLPPITASIDYLRGFMAGVVAADGSVDANGSVLLHTADYDYACAIRNIANRVGLPVVSLRIERSGEQYSKFATPDSKLWKLTFAKKYFQQDPRLILKNSHKEKMNSSPISVNRTTIRCVSVEPTDRVEEVFCCNQETTHTFTLGNGILTGNCYVGPRVKTDPDSLDGIFEHVRAQAQTLKSEGGWGENFSYLRPRGAFIGGIGVETPGSVKYMEIFDKVSDVITAGSGRKSDNKKAKGKIRKGAMMGVLDCLGGNTPINTLFGKVPIKDLVGQTPYLYCTDGQGNVYVRQALLVWSKGIKKTVRVIFDNDDYIECTPEHEFMLSDGTYRKAKDLTANDSLAALNKRLINDYLSLSAVDQTNHKVVRVESAVEQEVFDISMPDYHNFVANGVFVHNCWHPDIMEFITAKQHPGRLTKFNVSVNCTDDFMQRVVGILKIDKMLAEEMNFDQPNDAQVQSLQLQRAELDKWQLVFPDTTFSKYKSEWQGDLNQWRTKGYPEIVYSTISALQLWDLIMQSTYNRAEPGVLFLDRANQFLPLNYAETVYATNPSMPARTLVHTKNGIVAIETLEGKTFFVKSLDGTWAPAQCRMSGEDEELLTITLGANKQVQSTKQHRWPVYDKRMDRLYKVDASALTPGDLIPLNRNESIGIYGDMSLSYDEGLFVGYLLGDGWITKKYKNDPSNNEYNVGVTFGIHEREMATRILGIMNSLKSSPSTICERPGELYIQCSDRSFVNALFDKYGLSATEKDIPGSVWKSNDLYIKGFVDGLLSADGCIMFDDNNQKIILTTSRESLAKNFGRLLGFAGVPTNIWTRTLSNSQVSFPNGQIYDRSYERWDVAVSGSSIINFFNVFDITHPDKRSKLEAVVNYVQGKRSHQSTRFIEVSSITPGGRGKVWDISVAHDQHVFPTEWCYTGNCGEQTLAPGGVCNLGSLNLTQFINNDRSGFDLEKLTQYTQYMVRFLDNINDLTKAPLPQYEWSIKNKRRIGVGILGWGSALYMLKTKFASKQADRLRDAVMQTIAQAAYMYSIDLAEEKGMFSVCDPEKHLQGIFIRSLDLPAEYYAKLKQTGIRNSSLLSIQPTGNTSIFANVVSGGLEPVFLHEYVRTVIVGTMPDNIADVTPKWFEGAWHETAMFKFTKEGDEEILRGIGPDGIVYKIDKNRGLTKEVLCEDYGVRVMKRAGLWNSTAAWAATALSLNVTDHVSDLKGFARWVDSSMSKTVNVPNEYPFEDFKSIYIDSYTSGYVKGVTTYRAGTMTTVLAAKDEKTATDADEEIVLEDVKLPDSAPATMKTLKAEGRKWYLTVLWWDDQKSRPFGFFVHTNSYEKTVTSADAVEVLTTLARSKKIPMKHINETLEKIASDNNTTKVARMISLNLRHGVLIKNIVAALDRVQDVFVGTFLFQIKKYLSTFIRDGEKAEGIVCSECQSPHVVFSEGCHKCTNCGSSKCG